MQQILIIAGIIGLLLFLRWIRIQPRSKQIQGILILAALVLIALAITGRLHPLFAIIGTAAASLQKFSGLLRFVPIFKNIFTDTSLNNSDSNDQTNSTGQVTKMTREEAHQILGINDNATKEEIIEAHRKLIQKTHPDRGGNDYLAAKINQAKEYLLKNTA